MGNTSAKSHKNSPTIPVRDVPQVSPRPGTNPQSSVHRNPVIQKVSEYLDKQKLLDNINITSENELEEIINLILWKAKEDPHFAALFCEKFIEKSFKEVKELSVTIEGFLLAKCLMECEDINPEKHDAIKNHPYASFNLLRFIGLLCKRKVTHMRLIVNVLDFLPQRDERFFIECSCILMDFAQEMPLYGVAKRKMIAHLDKLKQIDNLMQLGYEEKINGYTQIILQRKQPFSSLRVKNDLLIENNATEIEKKFSMSSIGNSENAAKIQSTVPPPCTENVLDFGSDMKAIKFVKCKSEMNLSHTVKSIKGSEIASSVENLSEESNKSLKDFVPIYNISEKKIVSLAKNNHSGNSSATSAINSENHYSMRTPLCTENVVDSCNDEDTLEVINLAKCESEITKGNEIAKASGVENLSEQNNNSQKSRENSVVLSDLKGFYIGEVLDCSKDGATIWCSARVMEAGLEDVKIMVYANNNSFHRKQSVQVNHHLKEGFVVYFKLDILIHPHGVICVARKIRQYDGSSEIFVDEKCPARRVAKATVNQLKSNTKSFLWGCAAIVVAVGPFSASVVCPKTTGVPFNIFGCVGNKSWIVGREDSFKVNDMLCPGERVICDMESIRNARGQLTWVVRCLRKCESMGLEEGISEMLRNAVSVNAESQAQLADSIKGVYDHVNSIIAKCRQPYWDVKKRNGGIVLWRACGKTGGNDFIYLKTSSGEIISAVILKDLWNPDCIDLSQKDLKVIFCAQYVRSTYEWVVTRVEKSDPIKSI